MTLTRAGILILGLILAVGVAASFPGPTVRAANQSFTLIGHQTSGWGHTVGNIDSPGPNLPVGQGDTVTLTLNATDNQPHTWFIDYDGDSQADTGENNSAVFNGGDPAITHTFVVTRAGSYTYRCSIHPATMTGTISIQGPAAPADNTLLIVGGVLVVVVIAAAAGAMMMRRRSKPPTQPPTQ